ncbi:MAG: molybdopterin-dependent oxidoreductase [Spirochaetes bacterium]|jgi:anaerobic selenocysteine-containing dehydrogenase|nr:molybdopterin-dependent oxidoreductase [Spirochaetota bacterium]
MQVTRRNFLKIATAICGVAATGGLAIFDYVSCIPFFKRKSSSQRGFCPFCGLNCALIIHYRDSVITAVEAEKSSFESGGRLCPKAHMIPFLANQKSLRELGVIRYADSNGFENRSYSTLLGECAELIHATREESFAIDRSGLKANNCESIAVVVGDSVSCEDAYVINKFSRVAGLTRVGTEALIKHEAAATALRATYGIAAQTNPHYDIKNSDLIVVIGSNPVRTSPMQLVAITEARKRGALLVVIDPVLSETAKIADIHLAIRPGTDLVLLCGLIRYLLHNDSIDKEYLRDNTDAPFLVNESFRVDSNGNFSGFSGEGKEYDTLTWSYIIDERGNPKTDYNLKRSNCVFQILKNNYSQYTPDRVMNRTGISSDLFLHVAGELAASSRPAKSCSFLFGGGLTESAGAQGVRAVSVMQLLCGNIGIAGGGLYGINNSANQQGISDQIGGWNCFPGYLPLPDSEKMENDYDLYIRNNSHKSNDFSVSHFWTGFKGYFESLMHCWFPDEDAKAVFDMLPRTSSGYNWSQLLNDIDAGTIKGLTLFEADLFNMPVPRERLKSALKKLSWIIMFETFPGDFSRYIGGTSFSKDTTVIIVPLPAFPSASLHFVSSERRFIAKKGLSLRQKSLPGIALALQGVAKKMIALQKLKGGVFSEPIVRCAWNYSSVKSVAKEMAGYSREQTVETVAEDSENKKENFHQPPYFCGNWLYADLIGSKSLLKRDSAPQQSLLRNTDRCWPAGAQVLFNNAGVIFKDGEPRHAKSVAVEDNAAITGQRARRRPFYFNKDGVAYLFARKMKSGPIPLGSLTVLPEIQESSYLLFGSDYGEADMAQKYKYYREYFPEDFLLMHKDAARDGGFVNGDYVSVKTAEGFTRLPLYVTDRIADKRYVKIAGSASRELLYSQDIKQGRSKFPVVVSVQKEASRGR